MECTTVECCIEEFATMLSSSRPTARKMHRCTECGRTIEAGEKYLRESTLYDNRVTSHKTCCDCESVRNEFFTEGWYYGAIHEMLQKHISECYGDISEDVICDLTPKAREAVCGMIEQYWEYNEEGDDE